MNEKPAILHSIPGRIQLFIPLLTKVNDPAAIEAMLRSMIGIKFVKLEPTAHTMLIHYDREEIREKDVLRYVSLFCECLEEVGEKVKDKQQTNAIKGLMASWVSLERNAETILADKVVAGDFLHKLSSTLGLFKKHT